MEKDVVIASLTRKNVLFTSKHEIDLSRANKLGNRSWGKIHFLQNKGFSRISGIEEYQKRMRNGQIDEHQG
jgi:hypothetical protein